MLLRFVTICLFVFSYPLSADNDINSKDNTNTIIVLGDSLSAAYGIDSDLGWVNLLRNRLVEDANTEWNIINASISGDTTAGALKRLPRLLDEHQPVLCILALGANDGLRGLPPNLMQNNLSTMVDLCNQTGEVLLIGMRLPPNYGQKYADAFHQVYLTIASKKSISLVPFLLDGIAVEDKFFQADRLHPTAEAQPIILDTIWRQLHKILYM